MTMTPYGSRLPRVLLLSGLLVATVVLLEPVKSAVWNWNQIGLGFSELLARLVVPFSVAFLAIAALAALLLAVAPRRSIPVLVALYVALWAQGSLFLWDYGSFDGSPIDWREHSGKGVFEVAFWAAALALALTKPEWIRQRALPITGMVLVLQLTAFAGLVHESGPLPEKPESEALSSIRSVSLYSRDLNVIIVVLDSFQSDFFSDAMDDPKLSAAMPPGFTYFPDAVSPYARTEFSLQSILTSRMVPDGVRIPAWKREQMAQSLPTRLAERGFHGVLSSFWPSHLPCSSGEWGFTCLHNATLAESGSASAAWREDVSELFALGLFRLSPHFLKRQVYDDGRFRIRRLYPPREAVARDPRIDDKTRMDLAVFDQLIASAAAGDTAPQFRLMHFFGSHQPSTVDESCDYTEGRKVIPTTRCVLSRLYEFLHKLDEIGVYDQSLIFVVADHGRARGHWKGVPTFLAKPLGDRHPLRTSELPVSLCDVPKSVLDALDIEHDFECESIFSEQSPRRFPRMHFRYLNWRQRRSLGLSEVTFEKYAIMGHSWLTESWIRVSPHIPGIRF